MLGLVTSLLVPPMAAIESRSSGLDPVISEVVEMLAAGVDEGVIVQWIESTHRRPIDIGSQGVIELTEAGASDELLSLLLGLVEEAVGAVSSEIDTRVESPQSPPQGLDSVEAVFRLGAKQVWTEEDEPDRPRDPTWDVYLYLDGEFVAWTRPSLSGEPVEVRREIEQGIRELRVVLQRYEEMQSGWLYESLSIPTSIKFEGRPGDPVEIEIELNRIWGLWRQRREGGPLGYEILQAGEILGQHGGTGGDPNRWQPICEDVEANFPDDTVVPRRFRNAMSRCIRWSTLWSSEGQKSRADILTQLEKHEFRPPIH